MPQATTKILILTGALVLALPVGADDTGLQHCVSIDDAEKRLACYDEAAGRLPSSNSVDVVAPITADYGAEQLSKDNPDRKSEKPVRVKITSCRKDSSRTYYFYLENGQVWKQNDDDRLRHRDCNFDATILRDGFGYKLQIDGQKRRTRVKRIK